MKKLIGILCLLFIAVTAVPESSADIQVKFYEAVGRGDLHVVEKALVDGARINELKNHSSALGMAASFGHESTVDLLLEKGANPNLSDPKYNLTPLMAAVGSGNSRIIRKLVKAGSDINAISQGMTVLSFATISDCDSCHAEVIKVLLELGADPNPEDIFPPATPLMRAVSYGTVNAVRALLKGGLDPNKRYPRGLTALSLAAQYGRTENVEALLDAGAIIDRREHNESTALMVAAHKGYLEIVRLLLNRGANPNAKDALGQTALMWASKTEWVHTSVIEALISKGADIHWKDNEGKTALQYAMTLEDKQKAQVLKKY
jgi:ankyrin repeat protein